MELASIRFQQLCVRGECRGGGDCVWGRRPQVAGRRAVHCNFPSESGRRDNWRSQKAHGRGSMAITKSSDCVDTLGSTPAYIALGHPSSLPVLLGLRLKIDAPLCCTDVGTSFGRWIFLLLMNRQASDVRSSKRWTRLSAKVPGTSGETISKGHALPEAPGMCARTEHSSPSTLPLSGGISGICSDVQHIWKC